MKKFSYKQFAKFIMDIRYEREKSAESFISSINVNFDNENEARQFIQEGLNLTYNEAKKGNAEAMFIYGSTMSEGYEAVEWLMKSAEKGFAAAYAELGFCYYYGIGVHKDKDTALHYYEKGIELGSAECVDGRNAVLRGKKRATSFKNKGNDLYNRVLGKLGL